MINTSTNLVIKTIQVNNGSLQIPNGAAIAITPDGKYAYVTYGPYLAVINTANNTVTKMIGFDSALNNVSLNLNNVAISPNGQFGDYTLGVAVTPNSEYIMLRRSKLIVIMFH